VARDHRLGRVGTGIGAELGSMKVTEQIDAMEASAVDPFHYLAATRVLACILMLPLLTVASNFSGIFMGWIATTLAELISLRLFLLDGCKDGLFIDVEIFGSHSLQSTFDVAHNDEMSV
jgi:phospholipid/cholesterol/gamma-HCH transport system permease protein